MNDMSNSASFLRRKYSEALKNNPRYSLRAFAARLGLSPGGLSHILSRRKKLSLARAQEIAETLKLTPEEKDEFLLLVQIEAATRPSVKATLYEQLKKISGASSTGVMNLSLESFQLISHWYGLAVLEMITHFAGDWGAEKIGEYLGVAKVDIEITLERLEKLEMIERTPTGYRRCTDRVMVNGLTPNEAFRNYYHQILDRADESIRTQQSKERVIGTEVFAFDPEQIPEARKLTDEYLNGMLDLAKRGKKRSEMYQVVSSCFRLNPKTHAQKSLKDKDKKK